MKDSKQKGQFVVVYRSGTKDLTEQTSARLCHKRKRTAQIAVQQEQNCCR